MTATTAHDLAVAASASAWRCFDAAKKVGNRRAMAKFERRALRAQATINEWTSHPALRCTIVPDADGFLVLGGPSARKILRRSTLFAAQDAAQVWGFRHIDLTACGRFA